MIPAGNYRVALSGIAVAMLVGCASLAVVDDHLETGGAEALEFSIDDPSVTLSARFSTYLPADERVMVEWSFPDGQVYLRKPVQRSRSDDEVLETSMPIRGKAPARYPGVWHVRLWHDGGTLVSRSFEIYVPVPGSGAQDFAGIAYCGPSRWHDAAISGRGSSSAASGRPGAWIGGHVLEIAGATYSGAILLTGCAPG